jgi:polyhydroxyalkanoate synthesis repressor PhaR
MSDPRRFKKYPNRRLYDTALSRYVTLEDVRRLVLDGVKVEVVDARTEEDLTRSVLLQIIMEQEEDGKPIFTTPLLTQIIRLYGQAVQGLASDFLQRSLTLFSEQQRLMQDELRKAATQDPVSAMAELTERNLALWGRMQKSFFDGLSHRRDRD